MNADPCFGTSWAVGPFSVTVESRRHPDGLGSLVVNFVERRAFMLILRGWDPVPFTIQVDLDQLRRRRNFFEVLKVASFTPDAFCKMTADLESVHADAVIADAAIAIAQRGFAEEPNESAGEIVFHDLTPCVNWISRFLYVWLLFPLDRLIRRLFGPRAK